MNRCSIHATGAFAAAFFAVAMVSIAGCKPNTGTPPTDAQIQQVQQKNMQNVQNNPNIPPEQKSASRHS